MQTFKNPIYNNDNNNQFQQSAGNAFDKYMNKNPSNNNMSVIPEQRSELSMSYQQTQGNQINPKHYQTTQQPIRQFTGAQQFKMMQQQQQQQQQHMSVQPHMSQRTTQSGQQMYNFDKILSSESCESSRLNDSLLDGISHKIDNLDSQRRTQQMNNNNNTVNITQNTILLDGHKDAQEAQLANQTQFNNDVSFEHEFVSLLNKQFTQSNISKNSKSHLSQQLQQQQQQQQHHNRQQSSNISANPNNSTNSFIQQKELQYQSMMRQMSQIKADLYESQQSSNSLQQQSQNNYHNNSIQQQQQYNINHQQSQQNFNQQPQQNNQQQQQNINKNAQEYEQRQQQAQVVNKYQYQDNQFQNVPAQRPQQQQIYQNISQQQQYQNNQQNIQNPYSNNTNEQQKQNNNNYHQQYKSSQQDNQQKQQQYQINSIPMQKQTPINYQYNQQQQQQIPYQQQQNQEGRGTTTNNNNYVEFKKQVMERNKQNLPNILPNSGGGSSNSSYGSFNNSRNTSSGKNSQIYHQNNNREDVVIQNRGGRSSSFQQPVNNNIIQQQQSQQYKINLKNSKGYNKSSQNFHTDRIPEQFSNTAPANIFKTALTSKRGKKKIFGDLKQKYFKEAENILTKNLPHQPYYQKLSKQNSFNKNYNMPNSNQAQQNQQQNQDLMIMCINCGVYVKSSQQGQHERTECNFQNRKQANAKLNEIEFELKDLNSKLNYISDFLTQKIAEINRNKLNFYFINDVTIISEKVDEIVQNDRLPQKIIENYQIIQFHLQKFQNNQDATSIYFTMLTQRALVIVDEKALKVKYFEDYLNIQKQQQQRHLNSLDNTTQDTELQEIENLEKQLQEIDLITKKEQANLEFWKFQSEMMEEIKKNDIQNLKFIKKDKLDPEIISQMQSEIDSQENMSQYGTSQQSQSVFGDIQINHSNAVNQSSYKAGSEGEEQKRLFYSEAVSIKLSLPPNHPGRDVLISDLYNEAMLQKIGSQNWKQFITHKLQMYH